VVLVQLAPTRQLPTEQFELALHETQVLVGHLAVGGDDHVTTTEGAAVLAEGQVDVQRQGIAGRQPTEVGGVVGSREALAELHGRGIGGVPGSRAVVALQQGGVDGGQIGG